MNVPATEERERSWMPRCFVISCLCKWRINEGQDDISVLNMESILLLDRWKVIDLEFVLAQARQISPVGRLVSPRSMEVWRHEKKLLIQALSFIFLIHTGSYDMYSKAALQFQSFGKISDLSDGMDLIQGEKKHHWALNAHTHTAHMPLRALNDWSVQSGTDQ